MNTLLLNLLSLILLATADKNTTVLEDDPSITYSGGGTGSGSAPICQFDSSGTLKPNQPGCYNASPQGCAPHIHALFGTGASVGFKFTGTGITVNALLGPSSALYNVTLDGETTSVDGSKDHQSPTGLLCAPLFTKTGLDASKPHEISVLIAALGPLEGASASPTRAPLFLQNFTVLSSDSNGNSNSSSSGGGNNTNSGGNGGGGGGPGDNGDDDNDSSPDDSPHGGNNSSTSGNATSSSPSSAPSQSQPASANRGLEIAVGSGVMAVIVQMALSLL